MIITFPLSAKLSKVKITNNCPTFLNKALNGYQSVRGIGAQSFEFDIVVTSSKSEIREFESFISLLSGRLNTFKCSIPKRFTCSDPYLSGLISASETNSGSSIVIITGINAGSFTVGDFVQFGNSSKLYIVSNFKSDTGELSIMPRLRNKLPAGTPLIYSNVMAELRLTSDKVSTTFKETHDIADFSFNAEEAI